MRTRKTRAETRPRARGRAGFLALAAVILVACGGSGGDAPPGDAAAEPSGEARAAEAPEPEPLEGGADTAEARPMPPLSVDRRTEPGPASLPPVGDLVELRGVVGTWPQVAGAEVRAAVQLQIADGFHVNANPPAEDWIIATEVTLEETPGIELSKVHYPPPQAITFDFWPEPLDVWEGDAVTGLELLVAPEATPGERTARVTVLYQACNDEACFRPMEATLDLALEIVPAGTASRPVESPLLERAPFPED